MINDDVWARISNLGQGCHRCRLEVHLFKVSSMREQLKTHGSVTVPANRAITSKTRFLKLPAGEHGGWVIRTRLIDEETNQCLARCVQWPQPLKHLPLRKPDIKLTMITLESVTLFTDVPVKCIELYIPDQPDVRFSDVSVLRSQIPRSQ